MGGLCSGGGKAQSTRKISSEHHSSVSSIASRKHKANTTANSQTEEVRYENRRERYDSGPLPTAFSSELRQSGSTASRGSRKGSVRRAGIVGIEMAVEVLDTLGSSMSNLNARNGFVSGIPSRGNKISILAFEVANTIAKGSHLLQSLSQESIKLFKKETLQSEAVQKLVSGDTKELLSIAAADKRHEVDAFSKEVIRFGDLCKDPQWHTLGRYFSKLESDHIQISLRNEAEAGMQELTTMAQYTSELYHELNALDRFQQDYAHRIEEADSLKLPRKGESLTILQNEIKQQRKLVRNLKKKSVWSKTLEEVVEKLVDIVAYMHQAIAEAFEETRSRRKQPSENPQKLGAVGLALHYANLVHQIDNLSSHPASVPPNVRDTLYNTLPDTVKTGLRSHLHSIDYKGKLSISQVKDQMDKTLRWLVPVAVNTTKAHQGFGWVGEWANNGHEFGKTSAKNNKPTRLETFYHADKQRTDVYILELVALLHHLIILVRQRDVETKPPLVFQTKIMQNHVPNKSQSVELSQQERSLVENSTKRVGAVRGRSKSEDLEQWKKREGTNRWLSRSAGNSPARAFGARLFPGRSLVDLLDVMDGLDQSSFSEPKS